VPPNLTAATAKFYMPAKNQPKKKFGQDGTTDSSVLSPLPKINSSAEFNIVFCHFKLCFADFKATRLLKSLDRSN